MVKHTRAGLSASQNRNRRPKRTHARKLNMARRQLSVVQKNAITADAIKENSKLSDRQIAKGIGVANSFVSKVRKKLEDSGELFSENSSMRIGELTSCIPKATSGNGSNQYSQHSGAKKDTGVLFSNDANQAEDQAKTEPPKAWPVKPKPQPPKSTSGKTIWRCTICGYEYEGEELPADFICPICKHPASDFEKVTV